VDALDKTNCINDSSKLPDFLSCFFSDLLVFPIDSENNNYDAIITPCMLLRTAGTETFLYVVLNITTTHVLIFDPVKKDYTIGIESFKDLLIGSVIIVKEVETYNPSKQLLRAYQKEQQDDNAYLKGIRIIDNFITKEACKAIIDFYEENNTFERSRVTVGTIDRLVSSHRTSSSAMMEASLTMPIVLDLKTKIAKLLDCEIAKIESLQSVRYYKDEEFKPHYDSLHIKNRKLTCLLYLNEGFTGGETYFPLLNYGVAPKLGRLLIFKNLRDDGSLIEQSLQIGRAHV
jgi:prolyl 4-hydroxylase